MRNNSAKPVLVLSISLVLLVSFSPYNSAQPVDPEISESTDFTVAGSYSLEIDSGDLTFPQDSGVTEPDTNGLVYSNQCIIFINHNYDITVNFSGDPLDTTVDGTTITLPTDYLYDISYGDGSGWNVSGSVNAGVTHSESLNVTTDDTTSYLRVQVSVLRDGLNDPSGTYSANLDVWVTG